MKSSILIQRLDMLAPPEYAESWDNPGLLVGNSSRDIHKVYIALDADGAAVERAVACGCDMILTHHPLLFTAIKSIRDEDFIGHRLMMMIENKINYFAMHTNFDVAVMADLAADRLQLQNRLPLAMARETENGLKGIGTSGELLQEMTFAELAEKVKQVFELPQVRCYGDPKRLITKVSMCPGSGKGMDADVINADSQAFITGDVDHHYGIDCVEKGICVIDAGHHGLEHIFVPFMEQWFKQNCPEVETVTDRNQSPFFVI